MKIHETLKKKIEKSVALASAFILALSNISYLALAKEDKDKIEPGYETIGSIAEPYIPDFAKRDKNGNPVYDENGNFIIIDEGGKEVPREILDLYTIKPNEDGNIIYELDNEPQAINSRTVQKVINLNSKNINIRKSESTSSTIVGKFPPNKVATLLQDNGNWLKINYNGIIGWITKDYVVLANQTPQSQVKNIAESSVNIRSGSATTYSILGSLPKGAVAYAVDQKNGWFKIIYNDLVGWVSGNFVKYTNISSSQSAAVSSGALSQSTYVQNTSTKANIKTSIYMKDSSNRHFYCLNPERSSPNGHPFYRGNVLDDVAYRILKNGYPNKSFTGDATTDRIITQMAFWAHVDSSRVDINNITAIRNNAVNNDMLNHIKNLYNTAKSGTNTQSVSVEFSKTSLTANFDKDSFVTDYITLTGKGDIKSATIALKFYNTADGKEFTNIKAIGEDGKEVKSVSLGQKFKLVIPKSVPSGNVKVVGNATIQHDVAVAYSTNLGGIQDSATIETLSENKAATNNVIINWKGVGNLSITKTDAESKSKLEGAQFSITDSTGTKVETITTDKNGFATSKQLPFGTYKVQEIKAPTNYVLDSKVHTVTIDSTTTLALNYTNTKIKGSISITKVDSEDSTKVLQGAEFTLFTTDNKEVAKATTNDKGIAQFNNIEAGNYLIKETKAPTNYVLDSNTVHKVTISENGKVYPITAKNSLSKGSIIITKVDSEDSTKVLQGAEFTLYNEKGEKISSAITDEKGQAIFTNLELGKYSIKETKSPLYYELDNTTVHTAQITKNGESINIVAKNKLIIGSVTITKVDAADETKVLEGAEFTLYSEDNKEIAKAVTDKNGLAKFDNILEGKYFIKETKAPKDYLITDDIKNIDVTEKNRDFTFKITNSKELGEFEFSKTDVSTGEIIEGATIEIKGLDEANKHINFTFISSKEGNKFSLPHGKYEFKETLPPDGYVLSTEVGEFEIKPNGDIVKAKLDNKRIIGDLKIIKVDSADQTPLTGAEFKLTNSDGKEIDTISVDKDGVAIFKGLYAGKYLLTETKSPEGYELLKDSIEVEITKDGEVVELSVENTKIAHASIKILKVDSNKKDLVLKGAKFDLYDSNDTLIESGTTNEEGILTFNNLTLGKYSIKESAAPDLYERTDKIFDVELSKDGEVFELTIENTPKLAQTGGNFTFSQLIFTGLTMVLASFVLLIKDRGGLR